MAGSIPDGGKNKSQGSTTHTQQASGTTGTWPAAYPPGAKQIDISGIKFITETGLRQSSKTPRCLCTLCGNGTQMSSLLGEIFQWLWVYQSLTWGHAETQSSVPQLPTPRAMKCIELSLHFPHTTSPEHIRDWYMRYAHSTAKFCLWGSHGTCCSLINLQDPRSSEVSTAGRPKEMRNNSDSNPKNINIVLLS